jgi:hypothetical protein
MAATHSTLKTGSDRNPPKIPKAPKFAKRSRTAPKSSKRADTPSQGPFLIHKQGSEVAVRGARFGVCAGLKDVIHAELGNLGRLESVLRCLAHSMDYQSTDDSDPPDYPDVAQVACDLLKRSLADLELLFDGYLPDPPLAGRKTERM